MSDSPGTSRSSYPRFIHGERAITRFPSNVESICVVHESTVTWIAVRRNDVELRFPLEGEDRRYLAGLLLRPGEEPTHVG